MTTTIGRVTVALALLLGTQTGFSGWAPAPVFAQGAAVTDIRKLDPTDDMRRELSTLHAELQALKSAIERAAPARLAKARATGSLRRLRQTGRDRAAREPAAVIRCHSVAGLGLWWAVPMGLCASVRAAAGSSAGATADTGTDPAAGVAAR